MNQTIEKTVEDVYKSMMELESDIINDKKLIRNNNYDENTHLQFSANIFSLFVKRLKHGFFNKGQFEKGNKLEELLKHNSEAISHKISANAIKALMNTTLYNVSPDDTFMELLKDYSEYLKPIILQVI